MVSEVEWNVIIVTLKQTMEITLINMIHSVTFPAEVVENLFHVSSTPLPYC